MLWFLMDSFACGSKVIGKNRFLLKFILEAFSAIAENFDA